MSQGKVGHTTGSVGHAATADRAREGSEDKSACSGAERPPSIMQG